MDIGKPIGRVRSWHALLAAWRFMEVALVGCLVLALLHLFAAKLLGLLPPCWPCYLWLLLPMTLAAAIYAWQQRPDPRRSAWLLDAALQTQNLFGSLLGMVGTDGPIVQELRRAAEAALGGLHPPTQFPLKLSRVGRWSWLPALFLCGALFLPQQDPFGWHDARQREILRDRLVAAATAAIDRELAMPGMTPAGRELLEASRAELATARGEYAAAAAVAKLQQQAAAESPTELSMAQAVLRETAAAIGTDSAIADLLAPATLEQEGLETSSPESRLEQQEQTADAAGSSKVADAAGTGQAEGAANQEANAGSPQPGSETKTAAAGTTAGGGDGGKGIGRGGGDSASGGAGEIAFAELQVRGSRVEGKTIEELMRYDDDAPDDAPRRELRQAMAAAAADAQNGLSHSRIPNAAAAAVRAYFESIAAEAEE